MSRNQFLFLVLLLGFAPSVAKLCTDEVVDFFCDAQDEPSTDFWTEGEGTHNSAKVTGIRGVGGLELFQGGMLTTRNDFPPSEQTPVTARILVRSGSTMSQEFTLCTRSDGTAVSVDRDVLEVGQSGSFSGFHIFSQLYFVQNGACLHLSKVSQSSTEWYMKLVIVGPSEDAVCDSSELVPLGLVEGEEWEITLEDNGNQLVGMVGSVAEGTNSSVALSCSVKSPSPHSKVVLFDYFKEDRDNTDQAKLIVGFSSVIQACPKLASVQAFSLRPRSMPCTTPMFVPDGKSKLQTLSQSHYLDQELVLDFPIRYQAIDSSTTYTDSQAFLVLMHISRVGLQTSDAAVSVRLEADLCSSTLATLVSNPRANSNADVVRSSPMFLHGIAACSSSLGQDRLEMSLFTTTDGTTQSRSGSVNILGPSDTNAANDDFAHGEIVLTTVRLLRKYISFTSGDAGSQTFQATGSAKEPSFLAGIGEATSLSASTTTEKPHLLVFFDAPQLSSPDLDFYCLKFSITVDEVAVSNKTTCLPVASQADTFKNKFFPFQMHGDAIDLLPGSHSIGLVYDTSCFLQTCSATNGHVTANGPWRLSAVTVSHGAYMSERRSLAADSACSCTSQGDANRQAWTPVDSAPVLEVVVTEAAQEVLILADVDRLESCQEQDVGLRIVQVENAHVVSEVSFYLATVPPKSFAWHGTVVLEPGTHTFLLEYTSTHPVLFCSGWDSVEHKLSALILPDAGITNAEPNVLPRFESAASSVDVTVSGRGFEEDSELRMGATACHQTTWVSESSLVCKTGPGVGAGLSTVATVDMVGMRTTEAIFSYAAPLVTSSPNSPVMASGLFVQLTGKSFGFHDVSPTVFVGSSASLHTRWFSDTSLHFHPPPGTSSAALDARIDGSGVDPSGTLVFHTYDAPVVSSVQPLFASTSGGDSITLLGANFGNADYSLAISVDETRCPISKWQSDTSVICALPAGVGSGLRVVGTEFEGGLGGASLGVLQNCTSDFCRGGLTMAFSYASPVLDSVQEKFFLVPIRDDKYATLLGRSNAPAAGAVKITAWGEHFGTFSHTQVALRVGGTSCGQTEWESATKVSCHVAPGINFERDVVLTVARQSVSVAALFSYDVPSRLADEVTFAPSVAELLAITVFGRDLGHHDSSPRISIGHTTSVRTEWISDSSVLVAIPDGVGADQDVSIRFRNESASASESFNLYQFSYAAPRGGHPALTDTNIPSAGASTITVLALHFGGADYSNRLGVHGTDCESSRWLSDTSMTCKTPAGAGFERVLTASVSTQFMADGEAISFDSPVVTALNQSNSPAATAGTTITMLGTNFGTWDHTPKARIGETACMTSDWVSSSTVLCKAPLGFNVKLAVSLTVERSAGTLSEAFTFDGIFPPVPNVSHAVPFHIATTGSDITVVGTFLGPVGLKLPEGERECGNRGAVPTQLPGSPDCPYLDAQDMNWQVSVAYQDCHGQYVGTACETTTWISESSLFCSAPKGIGKEVGLVVESWPPEHALFSQARSKGFADGAIQYKDPEVSVLTANLPSMGGNMTIVGAGFGTFDSTSRLRVGETACLSTTWTSDSVISCNVPSGRWSPEPLVLTMSEYSCGGLGVGSGQTLGAAFEYDTATIVGWSAGSGDRLELSGLNFGMVDLSPTVVIQATAAAMTEWVSDSSVVAAFPSGVGGSLDLFVEYERTKTMCTGRNGTANETCKISDTEHHKAVLHGGFSYALPTATAVVTDSIKVWSGNFSITILGTEFGILDYSPQSRVGYTSCESALWLSSTSILCKVPQGSHAGATATLPIQVSVEGQVGQGSIFDYENKGAVKLSVSCAHCADPGDRENTIEQAGFPIVLQPKVQIMDHWERPVTPENDTVVSVSLLQDSDGISVLGGTTAVTVVNGLATFTDLRVDGGSAGNQVRLRFTAPDLKEIESTPFQVAYVVCKNAYLLSDPQVTGFEGGSTLTVQLQDFYPFASSDLNWTFSQQVNETYTATLIAPVDEISTSPDGLTTLSGTIPARPLAWDPVVDVGLRIVTVEQEWPPAPCFEIIMIDLTLPRVQAIAPGFCTTLGNANQDIIVTDNRVTGGYSESDFDNMELVMYLDGAEYDRVDLTKKAFNIDGTRVLSFTCPPYPKLDTLNLAVEIDSGPEQGQLVCCEFVYFEPVAGFTLKYIPPPAVITPQNLIPSVSHNTAELVVYFPEEKFGVNATMLERCDAVMEDHRTRLLYDGQTQGAEHKFILPLISVSEGRFPRTIPVQVECRSSSLGQVSSGASVVFHRQPLVSRVVPRQIEVYGGVIEISIEGFLFPLRADQLIIELHMPSGDVVNVEQFSIPVQGSQRTVFALVVPESIDLVVDNAFYIFKPQVVPAEIEKDFFEARADFAYFQPPPEIVEMEPNVVEADGDVEILLLVSKLQSISSPSEILIVFEDDPLPLEVTQIIFSDEKSTSLKFQARAHTPGPVAIMLSSATTPNNTGTAILTYQGIGVSATCSKVKRAEFSQPVDLQDGDPCLVSSGGDSVLTLRLQGFGEQTSDLQIVVGGILQGSDSWSPVAANAETVLIDITMPEMPSNIERGPDGCFPPQITQNIAAFLQSDQTKMAITTFSYNTVPCLTSSRFAPSGIELELRFNQQTDQGGIVGSEFFDCARVLSLVARINPWGDGGTCFWINAKQLNVMLGPGEDEDLVNVADFISVRDSDLEIRPALGFNLTASGTYLVSEPARFVLPQVRISGPNQASACILDQLVLAGLVTSPRSVTFSWSADDESLNALVSSKEGAEVSIPSSELVSGRDYVISVEVRDFLGVTSERAEHNLRKVPSNIPVVRIDGARPFLASQSNFFLTVVRFSKCIPEKEEMWFSWSVLEPAGPDGANVIFESTKPSLDIPPGVLQPSTKYTVNLGAGNEGRVPGLGSLNFETGVSPLISSIDGGDRLQPKGIPLELDASLSRDPDKCLYDAQLNDVFDITDDCFKDLTGATTCTIPCSEDSLVYTWSCRVKGLNCRKLDYSPLEFPSGAIIEVDLTEIADDPTEIAFEVLVSKGSRSSVSPVRVTVVDLPSIPTLDIVLGFTRKTDSAGVRYVNRVDTIRGVAVTDYCDDVNCTQAGIEPEYRYSVVESIDLEELPGNVIDGDNPEVAPAGLNTPSIVINPQVLVTGKQYALKLELSRGGDLLATTRLFLQINQPPSAGKCSVNPTTGIEIITSFAASCQKWFDQDLPLQYVFGYQARMGGDVMETPAQLGATYEMKLPAGYIDITISVVDSLGSPTVTRLLALVNETAADESSLDNLDSMTGDAGKLGDTSALVQQSSSAASQLEASRRRGGQRNLLASSAAYRMRVRRMLLRKAAGADGNVDKTSGGPILGSVQSLTASPEETVPQAGDPNEAVTVVDNNADLVYTSVCSVSSQELAGETANKAMGTLAQLVSSVNLLPVSIRDRTLLSAITSVTQITRSIGQGMAPGEPSRTLGKDDFLGAVQKQKVPAGLEFNVGNALPGLNYSFKLPQWAAEAEVILPSVYVSLPWETNLTDRQFPISPVFGVEVVVDRSKERRRRRGRRRVAAREIPKLIARDNGPMRPFRRADATQIFGQPDIGSELENLEVTVIMPLRLQSEDENVEVERGVRVWNQSVIRQILGAYNQTVQCLQWNGFSWSDQNCPNLPIVSPDGETVRCRCTKPGLFVAVYTVPDEPLDDRDVVIRAKSSKRVLGWPIWYTLVVGVMALVLTLVIEAKWYFELQAAPYLHSDVHEARIARRYVLSGWFGENYPEESQFHRTPTQILEDRKKRFQDQSFKGFSFIINRDGDQTLVLSASVHEFGDINSAKTVALLDKLKTEIALVLGVEKNRVRIGEVDQVSENSVEIHVFYSNSLLKSARSLAEKLKRAFDTGHIQERAEATCLGRRKVDLELLTRLKEVKKGFDPVGLFVGTQFLESFKDPHEGTVAALGVGKSPRYQPSRQVSSMVNGSEVEGPESYIVPAADFRKEPNTPAAVAQPELHLALDDDSPAAWAESVQDVTWTRTSSDDGEMKVDDVRARLAGPDAETLAKIQQRSLHGSVRPSPPMVAFGRDGIPDSMTSSERRLDDNNMQHLYGAAMASYLDGIE